MNPDQLAETVVADVWKSTSAPGPSAALPAVGGVPST
jgi:hypothetical protein